MKPRDKLAAGRLMACERLKYFRAAITGMVPRQHSLTGPGGEPTVGVTRSGVMLWNPEALEKWSAEEVAGVVVHEAMHLLRDTAGRREVIAADPVLFNIASDLALNPDIIPTGLKLPDGGCFPKNFGLDDGLTAEEYYRALLQMAKKAIEQALGEGGAGVGKGHCGGCAGNPGEDEEGEGGAGDGGRSDVEIARIRRTVAEEIRREVEAGSGRGTVPGGWARWAEGQLRPAQIPWRQKLARAVRGAVAYRPGAVDLHYTRPSRRQAGIGFGPGCPVLPALRAPVPQVAVVADTSGSMGEQEMVDAMSETRGVLAAAGANVVFCACDADVHALKPVRTWQEAAAMLKGGGGTSFIPAFEALEKINPRPNVIIFVTDGMGPAPKVAPAWSKVIWLLVGPHRTVPASWGEVVELKDTA